MFSFSKHVGLITGFDPCCVGSSGRKAWVRAGGSGGINTRFFSDLEMNGGKAQHLLVKLLGFKSGFIFTYLSLQQSDLEVLKSTAMCSEM